MLLINFRIGRNVAYNLQIGAVYRQIKASYKYSRPLVFQGNRAFMPYSI